MQSYLSLLKNPQWDAVFFLALVAAGFFWGLSGGKKKMALAILALYALIALFPFLQIDALFAGRAPTEILMFRAAAFLILLILLALFLIRSFKSAAANTQFGGGVWWEVLLLAILAAGFLTASLVNLAPPAVISGNLLDFSPLALKFFADPAVTKWWLILPIFGVIFL